MPSNAINNPRIDRAFVNGNGQLTEYGYAVLARLIERVGGAVGDILNGAELTSAIEALSLLPPFPDHGPALEALRAELAIEPPQQPAIQPDAVIAPGLGEVLALLQNLDQRIAALEIGYQL